MIARHHHWRRVNRWGRARYERTILRGDHKEHRSVILRNTAWDIRARTSTVR